MGNSNFTMSRKNPLIWWAFLLTDDPPPRQTDLCRLFWRSVLITPLKLLVIGFVLSVLIVLIRDTVIETGVWALVAGIGIAFTLVASIGSVIYLFERGGPGRRAVVAVGQSPVGAPVKYLKANFCPRISIEREVHRG